MPRKRPWPIQISHIIIAKLYTSAARVSLPSFSTSGAQYVTVPVQATIQATHSAQVRMSSCQGGRCA